jgi:flagellar protein FliS
MTTSASDIYQQVEVNTSNELKLVVMLYEGAIRFLTQARTSIQNKSLIGKATGIDRALAVLGELQSTLRLEEGGEIAGSLNRLYTYMTGRIIEASTRLDTRPLDEVIKLLRILCSAWAEVAQKADPQPSQPVVPDVGRMTGLASDPRRAGTSSLQVVG